MLLAAGCSSDQQETHYKTLVAAELAGAVHQGWIPDWLPKNANTLKEKHDAKGSAILRFAFPQSDKWAPSSGCRRVGVADVRPPAVNAPWWPQDLPSTITTPRYSLYACGQGREFLAVDFAGGEALHWRP